MKENLLENIQHYGINHQLRKLAEEHFELNEAIMQYEHINDYDKIPSNFKTYGNNMMKEHIAEEIADNLSILIQIQLFYEISDEQIEYILKYKTDRQAKRRNNGD